MKTTPREPSPLEAATGARPRADGLRTPTPRAPAARPARAALEAALAHAAHSLPQQGPIGVFIHHNTLHALQHLPFCEAVERAAERFDAEPYLSQERYREELKRGRIGAADLEAELDAELTRQGGDRPLAPGLSRRALWRAALLPGVEPLTGAALQWRLTDGGRARRLRPDAPPAARARVLEQTRRWLGELAARGDRDALAGALLDPGQGAPPPRAADAALRAAAGVPLEPAALARALARDPEPLAAHALTAACRRAALRAAPLAARVAAPRGERPRDRLLALTGEDADELIHPHLIRWVAAFLDQGVAYWPMPERERGLFATICELWARPGAVAEPWARGLRADVQEVLRRGLEPADVVLEVLAELAVPAADLEQHLTRVLLALPGWAGMVRVLEERPHTAPVRAPRATLMELLALRLLLDRRAALHLARRRLGASADLARLPAPPPPPTPDPEARAWLLREAAEAAGLAAPDVLAWSAAEAVAVLDELERFGDWARRRVWHHAYERAHREPILTAVADHRAAVVARGFPGRGRLQVAVCLDERAESLRRHLEEADGALETFGTAGFFGLAIEFQGLEDPRHAALCPIVATPEHVIYERPRAPVGPVHARRRGWRRALGLLAWAALFHSRQLVGGLVGALALGLVSVLPLAARTIAPRLSARLRARTREVALGERPSTTLTALRDDAPPGAASKPIGFTVEEAALRVGRLLEELGLTRARDFGELLAVIGHGSTSVNNPHASAYDCGACGGRRGAPNARLFAALANDPRVRAALRERGVELPEATWVVGGYHDTCTSEVTLFDLEQVPPARAGALARLRAALDQARAGSAQERCRRFESAPLDVTPEAALRHVEARAAHLAEPRPELGHATNAVCLVGRRGWTRGLLLDRRAFLVSYDPTRDEDALVLTRVLAAAAPVGAGINLEYFFSRVDNERYGCGSKLPHNVTGLLGVMNGHQSDLRTGLPWQMVELHEPVRMLTIVEATPAALELVTRRSPLVAELVTNGWIQLVSMDPQDGSLRHLVEGAWRDYAPPARPLPEVTRSREWFGGRRDPLPPARVLAALAAPERAA